MHGNVATNHLGNPQGGGKNTSKDVFFWGGGGGHAYSKQYSILKG